MDVPSTRITDELCWHLDVCWCCAGDGGGGASIEVLTKQMDEMDIAAQHRSVTGVLASHPDSRDLHIHNLSILFHGSELLTDSKLELNVGKRYGLIGLNGCGE